MGEKIFMSSYYDWIVAIILLIIITGMWIYAYKEEQKATPVVTNLTQTSTQLIDTVIPSSSNVRGKSGYAKQSLAEPCVKTSSNTVSPNIPTGFQTNTCDETKFLSCFDGVVEGGGICLKNLYAPCEDKSECTPEADYCMNGYCQKRSGTLNKVCVSDSDCQSQIDGENNVCDPLVGRCRIPQYPKGSGCTIDQQCEGHIDGAPNNQVACVRNPSQELDGKNVCVTKLPLGAKITQIGNLNVNYPCQFGLKELNGHCVEISRSDLKGEMGEVCNISVGSLVDCKSGLSCGYDNGLHNILETNNNIVFDTVYYPGRTDSGVSVYNLGGENINNIGYCGRQIAVKDQSCNSRNFACVEPYVCINEEINSKAIFNHCGHAWDSLNGSGLVKCPDGFGNIVSTQEGPTVYPICLAETGTVCNVNEDCSGDRCGTEGFRRIMKYSPGSEKFVIPDDQPGQNIQDDPSLRILMSKEQINQKPTCFGYSKIDVDSSSNPFVNVSINQLNGQSKNIGINFYFDELTQSNKDSFKYETRILKKSDGSFRVGLFYLREYQNYIRREYPLYRTTDSSGFETFSIDRTCGLRIGSKYYIFYIYDNEVRKSEEKTLASGDLFTVSGGLQPIAYINQTRNIISQNDAQFARQVLLVTYDNRYQFNYNSKDFVPDGNPNFGNDPNHTYITSSLPFENSGLRTGDLIKWGNTGSGGGLTFKEFEEDQTTASGTSVFQPDGNTISTIVSGGSFEMSSTRLLYTDRIPSEMKGRDRIFLSESYSKITDLPTRLGDDYFNSLEVSGLPADEFIDSEDELYMYYLPCHGIQMVYYDLNESDDGRFNLTISTRKDVVDGNINSPIGLLTDINDLDLYSIDMTEDKLIVGCQVTETENHMFQCSYTVSDSEDSNTEFFQYYEVNSGDNYINYGSMKSYLVPRPRVHKSGGYVTSGNESVQPYKLDESRFYEDAEEGVDHMISYKEVNSDSYTKLNIANQVKLRSFNYGSETGIFNPRNMNFFYDGVTQSGIDSKIFSGVYGTPNDPDYFLPNDTVEYNFGFCQPVGISDILPNGEVKRRKLTDSNYYLENGEGLIYFKNKADIDIILKYSSSELVLGFFLRKNRTVNKQTDLGGGSGAVEAINSGKGFPFFNLVIPEIYDYTINDETLEETLVMKTNFKITYRLENFSVFLYPNNIVPVSSSLGAAATIRTDQVIIDPGLIYTSMEGFGTTKTGYNKVLTNNSIYNIQSVDSYDSPSGQRIFTDKFLIKSTGGYNGQRVLYPFSNSSLGIGVAYSAQERPYFDMSMVLDLVDFAGNQLFLVNNLFLSSMMLRNDIIFSDIYYPTTYTVETTNLSYPSDSPQYRSRNYLFTKYTDSDGNQKSRARGDLLLPINTIPFYTGNKGNQSAYDQSFKTQIEWPSWLTDLNSVPLKMEKMIFSFNPGNIVNEMFYYALAEISGEKYLLYLPVNMSETNAVTAETVPFIVRNNDLTNKRFVRGFVMTPYDRSLYILGNICS